MSGLLAMAVGVLAISAVLPVAFGHGIGGDQAEPISFEGMEVTVRTDITPADLTIGSIDDVNLKIRFFDLLTDNTLEKVTYRVEIWKNELLAGTSFYDDDGILYVEVRPTADCDDVVLWRCTIYGGSEHSLSVEALYVQGLECNDDNLDACARPTITGPVFDRGGLYNIKIDITGATSPKALVAERLSYDTFVSIAQEQDFLISTAHAQEVPVVVKTYYDDVKNFAFDASDNSITFDMPFDWSPDYVDLVPVVHEEIQIPSSFAPYARGTQFTGYVNGIELGQRALLNDPYTTDDTNIIHFLVSQTELLKINDALGPEHHANKNMNFRLVPSDGASKNFAEFYLVDTVNFEPTPTTVQLSWDSTHGAGQTVPFEFAFFDSDRQLVRDVWYAYSVSDESGQELSSSVARDPDNPAILSSEGIDVQDIHVKSEGLLRIDVLVVGAGLDYDATNSGIGSARVEVGSGQIYALAETPPTPPTDLLETLPPTDLLETLPPTDLLETTPPDDSTGESNGGGGGCLIATAAYGSELAPQVQQLRELRDNTVLPTGSGAAFMALFNQVYYSFSPAIADLQREHPVFREAVRIALTPMLASLSLLNHADIDSEGEMLGYGVSIILLNLGMYVGSPVFGAAAIICRNRQKKIKKF